MDRTVSPQVGARGGSSPRVGRWLAYGVAAALGLVSTLFYFSVDRWMAPAPLAVQFLAVFLAFFVPLTWQALTSWCGCFFVSANSFIAVVFLDSQLSDQIPGSLYPVHRGGI
jgi:hypothetical protein